jgi:hypothetical protein
MEHQGSWDKNMPLAEFSYNNSYQESKDGTIWSVVWTLMPHSTQLYWAGREDNLCTQPYWRGWGDSQSHSRQLNCSKVTARKLCKQQASTLGVWSWRSCVSKSFAYEGHEEVWSERKISTSLHWTLSHTSEVWKHGILPGIASITWRIQWTWSMEDFS